MERQHHKGMRRRLSLTVDNDAVYTKALVNMVLYGGVLNTADASNNVLTAEYCYKLDKYFAQRLQQCKA